MEGKRQGEEDENRVKEEGETIVVQEEKREKSVTKFENDTPKQNHSHPQCSLIQGNSRHNDLQLPVTAGLLNISTAAQAVC